MPHSAPTEVATVPAQPPAEPKSSTMLAPGPQPPQQPHPEGLVPRLAPAQAAAVPPPASGFMSQQPASVAAAQGGEQGSSGESSTEQPALQSLIRRLLGGKQQVQHPSQLLQAEHRPSGLKRKLEAEAEAEAAARGCSPADAAQQGAPGGSDAEATAQLGAALAKRSRLATEEMDEERRLRDRQVGGQGRDLLLSTAFHPMCKAALSSSIRRANGAT